MSQNEIIIHVVTSQILYAIPVCGILFKINYHQNNINSFASDTYSLNDVTARRFNVLYMMRNKSKLLINSLVISVYPSREFNINNIVFFINPQVMTIINDSSTVNV